MNNFDTSSTGVELTLIAHTDGDLSRIYFEENIINISRSGGSLIHPNYRNVDIFQYIQEGEFSKIDLEDLSNYNYTKVELKEVIKVNQCYNQYSDTFVQSYIDDLNDRCKDLFDKTFSKLCLSELEELFEDVIYFEDKLEVLTKNFVAKYDVVSVIGYCQGDYAEVIIPQEYWQGGERTPKALSDLQEHLEHLFYDAPIYIRLDVGMDGKEEEYYLDENLEDRYEYDKENVMEYTKKLFEDHPRKEYILQWLGENLGETLEFVG